MIRIAALAALSLTSCLYASYVLQQAPGQLELLTSARPLDEVIRDPETPLRTAMMLAEIPEIKRYGRSYGLSIQRNYDTYVQLKRPAAVWFVGAADQAAFKPKPWCFPIVGCFPGLGFFDEDEAIAMEQKLIRDGYDTVLRTASAYSTGGRLPDPVMSSMLGGGDDALPYLANTILHESVHATVLIKDEQFFNESLAEYIADVLTDHWIEVRFGPGSPEQVAWTLGQARYLTDAARRLSAYAALKAVYSSNKPRAEKLAEKAKIIDALVADLHMRNRPNNATLNESKLYNGGAAALREAHVACGDIAALIRAAKTLKRKDFTSELQDDLTPIGKLLGERCMAGQKRT